MLSHWSIHWRAYDYKNQFFHSSVLIFSFSIAKYGGAEVAMIENNSHSANDLGIVTIKSGLSFSQTVERLKSVFQSHGIKVFAVIDQ